MSFEQEALLLCETTTDDLAAHRWSHILQQLTNKRHITIGGWVIRRALSSREEDFVFAATPMTLPGGTIADLELVRRSP